MDNRQLTNDIKKALNEKYQFPEWIFLTEVPNATGNLSSRRIDGFAFNLYPSKKYQKIAFEIKTLKSDLQHELKDGSKSDAIAKFCDSFYLVVPKGLITKDIEIPLAWGVMEYANGKVRQVKRPSQLEPCAFSDGFVAGILQSIERKHYNEFQTEKELMKKDVEVDFERRVENAVEVKIKDLEWDNHNKIEYNKFMKVIQSIDRFSHLQMETLMQYLVAGIAYKNIANEIKYTTSSINQMTEKLNETEAIIKKEKFK